MVEFHGTWSDEEVAAFLGDATIPIRLAARKPDGTPWIVALWFRYRDGCFECATESSAHLVSYLRSDAEVGFDVSTNDVPYRGVRGSGTATLEPDEDAAVLRDLIERYLGGTDSQLAAGLLEADREEVRIRIEPERIYSWDFSERMRDVDRS